MRFALTDEQQGFARSLDDLLAAADTPAVIRSWAAGEPGPGLALWKRLCDLGVGGLLVPEEHGGLGATPVDLVVAGEALGRHAVPGPWVESAGYLARVTTDGDVLRALADGAVCTVAAPPDTPRALDADVASEVYVVVDGTLHRADTGTARCSVDEARRLFEVSPADPVGPADDAAYDVAVLACSAQLLGLGERLLEDSVTYVKARRQFGRPIGSYQAIKHALADVRVGLDFARPLVLGAALSMRPEDVSAAKVATSESAYRAARTALQTHGAIGYTAEHDLGLWITKVRALVGAWGTPAAHRARLRETLLGRLESRGA